MTIKQIGACALLLYAAGAARADAVAVTARNAPAVTVEQACNAFLGKSLAPTPVNLPEGNPVRDEFYRKACDKDAQQVKATWSKLIFTGKAAAKPKEVASQEALKKLIAADPALVGYLERLAVDGSVRPVGN